MYAITSLAGLLVRCREEAGLTQRELAKLAGTAQSLVARIETGRANPTIGTVERLLRAAGCELQLKAGPAPPSDPVVAAYKRDVDRSLILENLRRSVDERLLLNADLLALTAASSGRQRRSQ